MTAQILKKWRQNWPFLLVVTILLARLSVYVADGRRLTTAPVQPPTPIWEQVFFWPATRFSGWIDHVGAHGTYLWPFILVLSWNAFLWAVVLLELKQVLARTVGWIRRAPR